MILFVMLNSSLKRIEMWNLHILDNQGILKIKIKINVMSVMEGH